MKVTFLKTYHEAREKTFALVLMLEMLFQKAAEKLVIGVHIIQPSNRHWWGCLH